MQYCMLFDLAIECLVCSMELGVSLLLLLLDWRQGSRALTQMPNGYHWRTVVSEAVVRFF